MDTINAIGENAGMAGLGNRGAPPESQIYDRERGAKYRSSGFGDNKFVVIF